MNKKRFADYFALCRKQTGLSQEKLAQATKSNQVTISRIEHGKELPRQGLFAEFDRVFSCFGVDYEDVRMNDTFKFDNAKRELLEAIHHGRAEEIENKLHRFERLIKEDSSENNLYIMVAELVIMRRNGLSIEEYLDKAIEILEQGREAINVGEIEAINLSRLEETLLYTIGMAHFKVGNEKEAERILTGLAKNSASSKSPYYKKRYAAIVASMAEILVQKKEDEKAKECIKYLFSRFSQNIDFRQLFKSLILQSRIFEDEKDAEGVMLIDDFMTASEKLVQYLYGYYGDETEA